MKPSQKEMENIIRLEPVDRYCHFLKRVADTKKMYSLCNRDAEFVQSNVQNHILIPLWPFEEYADMCRTHDWKDSVITEISLSIFESKIASIVRENSFLLNVFPVNFKTGFVVNLNEFNRDIADELEKYN
jgi:hypothetical protein